MKLTLLAAALCLGVSMLALELSRAGMSSAATGASPERYYLALGDSIAYGIQPAKVCAGAPPSGFDSGFVDVFSARLRGLAPRVRVVNYSCPGESTKTFIAGGCPWLAEKRQLHDPFRGAQLTAALSFLRAHRGQVNPITLTLGGNDLEELAETCLGSFACVRGRAPRTFAQFASRLTSILRPSAGRRAEGGDHRYRNLELQRRRSQTNRPTLSLVRSDHRSGDLGFEGAFRRHLSGFQSTGQSRSRRPASAL